MFEDKEQGTPIETIEDRIQDESDDISVVDWDGPNDPSNPMNWSSSRKWTAIGLVSFNTFNAYVPFFS